MPNDFLQAPTSDKELIQMALQGAKPPVEQMVAPEGPKNAQGDYLDALARYEQTFNEALRYLAQPPGQSNAPPGMAPPGVPTPQQFLRTQAPQVPLPQPPQVAASIAAAPPSLLQMQGGIVNMDTGHATPMPREKPKMPDKPNVQRAHAKLRDSEKKREKKFNPGKKVDPKDAPYKGGGDAEEARKTRLKSSIDSLFVP